MKDGLSAWAPATHVGNSDGVLGSWFWPGPALAIATICAMNQKTENLF